MDAKGVTLVESVDAKGKSSRVGKGGRKRKQKPKEINEDDTTVIWGGKTLCLVGCTERPRFHL